MRFFFCPPITLLIYTRTHTVHFLEILHTYCIHTVCAFKINRHIGSHQLEFMNIHLLIPWNERDINSYKEINTHSFIIYVYMYMHTDHGRRFKHTCTHTVYILSLGSIIVTDSWCFSTASLYGLRLPEKYLSTLLLITFDPLLHCGRVREEVRRKKRKVKGGIIKKNTCGDSLANLMILST